MFILCKVHCLETYEYTSLCQAIKTDFCEISDAYLLGRLRNGDKHGKDVLISCRCVLLLLIQFLNMLITCVQNLRPVCTSSDWRNELFAIGPIHTKFEVDIHIDLSYHPKSAESESENNF